MSLDPLSIHVCNEIEPQENDFLFIGSGGRWFKVRQQSAWPTERLRALSPTFYTVESENRRAFVHQHIIQVVQAEGGRFLRWKYEAHGRVVWYVDTNTRLLEQDLMRIMRSFHRRKFGKGTGLEEIQNDTTQKLTALSARVLYLQASMQQQTHSSNAQCPTLTLEAARKVQTIVDSMVKATTACQQILQGEQETKDTDKEPWEYLVE